MAFADAGLERTLAATAVLLLWLGLCGYTVWHHRRQSRLARAERRSWEPESVAASEVAPILVCYGSQTGNAEGLASRTARALTTQGLPVRLLAMSELRPPDLSASATALFLTSTYGEGDPPDNAQGLLAIMGRPAPGLGSLSFAVLALGDRHYKRFCGFGKQVDGWLRDNGASPLFDLVEIDNLDPLGLQRWQQQLTAIAGDPGGQGVVLAPDLDQPAWARWRLSSRRALNDGSVGAPLFHVVLRPLAGPYDWRAGDLVRLRVPGEPNRPRDYSIASLAADGQLDLLVRQQRHPDGSLGKASGWLTQAAPDGAEVELQVRSNPGFQIGPNTACRLILVGNGSGLAGLRAHLRESRARGGAGHWLIFGERDPDHDRPWRDELETWQASGLLARCDLVFSRAPSHREYVQDRLRQQRHRLKQWIADGAAIYVCGSALGMASGVQAALVDILGVEAIDRLRASLRYRRDVY